MQVVRTYKFKLYSSKKNRHLHRRIGIAGQVWNHCLALHKRYYKLTGKFLGKYDLMRHITKLKKLAKYSHWNLLDAQAVHDVVEKGKNCTPTHNRNKKIHPIPNTRNRARHPKRHDTTASSR